jgi:hypothetical protein
MVSSSIDHMVALTIFIAATLLFIGLFNQTIQTAVVYQNHRAIATQASDLLDTILLNPGIPNTWGRTTETPIGFGLQDPEFTQYKIDTFSIMRLSSSTSDPVYYKKANGNEGVYYANLSTGSGSYLLMPQDSVLDYSSASQLLGINGSYGFQLTLKPIVTVAITETQASTPLKLSIQVEGTSFPLANAQVSYKLFVESLNDGQYSGYTVTNGTATTDSQGSAKLSFSQVTSDTLSYAFIVSVHLSGINGVGYTIRNPLQEKYVVPLVGNFSENQILVAHSDDVNNFGQPVEPSMISYDARMVTFNSENFALQDGFLSNSNATIMNGALNQYGEITILDNMDSQSSKASSPGILIIAYNGTSTKGGFVMMPWGISTLSFAVTFGGDPTNMEWVSTDMRQVTVNGVAYQARLAIWSYKGYQVNG